MINTKDILCHYKLISFCPYTVVVSGSALVMYTAFIKELSQHVCESHA